MKKYAVILLLLANSVCLAQNSNIKFKFNKIEAHIKGRHKISKEYLYTLFILRKDKMEVYKEVIIKIDNNLYLNPGIGWSYNFNTRDNSLRTRLGFTGNFSKLFFKVVYGSDIRTYNVSTRLEYKFTNRFFAGIQSANEWIGPRVDYKLFIFNKKEFKIGIYYLSKDIFGFSMKFDIFDLFPKLEQERIKIKNWINGKNNKKT